jgi:hypothetical protein
MNLSFAKTRSPFVSTTWEMGCNVVELGYIRPRRGILESDDILAKGMREATRQYMRLRPARSSLLPGVFIWPQV